MNEADWQFCIDVGGTFTDVVARRPDGETLTKKLLSCGVVRGVVGEGSDFHRLIDYRRRGEPTGFWVGYRLTIFDRHGTLRGSTRIEGFDASQGSIELATSSPAQRVQATSSPVPIVGDTYEIKSPEPAPVLAIRMLMGLGLEDEIGSVDVRLGTTRATNALLERTGAKVALVTTRGFADVLRIGYQDRPELFALNIQKRDELARHVVEIDERVGALGQVLRSPHEADVHRRLLAVMEVGVESLAICLLHSHVNPIHEELVARVAESIGFHHVSVSSRVARMERIVPRGDTTVVDAYLTPVIRDYIRLLRRAMPRARLRMMTSHGGLVSADSALGKDLLLSGPAGGVVGCAHVARRAGFDRAIGFDMGGTSTDVSRIDPPPAKRVEVAPFEYELETVKDGVRIMTPMLAVETVAAGGGSLCEFDGQKLTVGPRSAGADPGPACYGRGGPLTVTDINCFLGRVVPAYFPFRLDGEVVNTRLVDLRSRIHEQTGSSLSLTEIAEGFLEIANAKMASAIHRISLAKGHDVRDFPLVCFGGAGAQHACAIAKNLGMRQVLCSPLAGVLSAMGISVADEKRIGQRSVLVPLDDASASRVEPMFEQIANRLREELFSDGVEEEMLRAPIRFLDVCYAGQSTHLSVLADPFDSLRCRFEHLHRQRYGYGHDGRAVEIGAVRVEITAGSVQSQSTSAWQSLPTDRSAYQTEMVVAGKRRSVPLLLRSGLAENDEVEGPAIIIEDTSTVVVDEGWRAKLDDQGNLLLTDGGTAPARERIASEVDPIQLELFSHRFSTIAQQMGITLRRTSLSTNVKERLDFSCAIFSPEGDLVVNAPHIPVHLGAMSDCVKYLMADVGTFEPGDVYITNDPYRGGSHLNDVTVVTPIHDANGKNVLFFVASRAHHAEIGGTRPGSMPPDSTTLAEEGVVIRAFPWIRNGAPQHNALRALLTQGPFPSRAPDENLADIAAQVAANQTGVRGLLELIDRSDASVVHAYMRHIQRAAEKTMRAAIEKLPDGQHSFADSLDDGSPIRLTVTIRGDRAELDFDGTGAVLDGNLNANPSIVKSAVLYGMRCLIDEPIPLNAGVLAPIEIRIPTSLLNPLPASGLKAHDDPAHCPAVVGGNVETSQRVVDCLFGALGIVAASQGTMNNLLMGNERFSYYETICGGAGAGPSFHGADAVHTHMTNTRMTDPEVLESRVPVRLVRFEIRRGSGGRGRYHGGDGVVRELEFLEPLEVSIISQRRNTAPYGLRGGESGKPGRNTLLRKGETESTCLGSTAHFIANVGDRLIIETPGGGGWGSAHRTD